jgi:predicted lipoprotein
VSRPVKSRFRLIFGSIATAALLIAMALDTKVVKIGSAAAIQPGVFSPAAFGASEFPKVQAEIEKRAVDAATLAEVLAQDKEAAGKLYGVATNSGFEFCVKFTGVAGKPDFGVYPVAVEGAPKPLVIHVQTGPAIYGTDLRDASGAISFDQFVNQIDYQNAGAALNKEMKKQVMARVDAAKLEGKTISVVGALKLGKPDDWMVTPVRLDVK